MWTADRLLKALPAHPGLLFIRVPYLTTCLIPFLLSIFKSNGRVISAIAPFMTGHLGTAKISQMIGYFLLRESRAHSIPCNALRPLGIPKRG